MESNLQGICSIEFYPLQRNTKNRVTLVVSGTGIQVGEFKSLRKIKDVIIINTVSPRNSGIKCRLT